MFQVAGVSKIVSDTGARALDSAPELIKEGVSKTEVKKIEVEPGETVADVKDA